MATRVTPSARSACRSDSALCATLNPHFRGDEMSTDSNASARSCSQVSQRMRLYRKRRRQGLQSVRILLTVNDIDYFIREGLTERQRQRPDTLENGLAGLSQQI